MPPSLGDRVAHVLAAIDDIKASLHGRSRDELAADMVLRLAVERWFEIISEASRHIPESMKEKAPHIRWREMADLGNWLRHAYHRVDPDILWNIAQKDLDPLRSFVEVAIRDAGDTP